MKSFIDKAKNIGKSVADKAGDLAEDIGDKVDDITKDKSFFTVVEFGTLPALAEGCNSLGDDYKEVNVCSHCYNPKTDTYSLLVQLTSK